MKMYSLYHNFYGLPLINEHDETVYKDNFLGKPHLQVFLMWHAVNYPSLKLIPSSRDLYSLKVL